LVDGAITVVLGPGLAPGLAGLGVLAAMQERGLPISQVIGVNTGALAAALWAVESDLALGAKVLGSLPWEHYVVARDLGTADPLLAAIQLLTRGMDFEKTQRRIAVVAMDAEDGRPVWIEQGSIALAVRGALSLPGLFHPLAIAGRRLLDGGCVWHRALPPRASKRLLVCHGVPAGRCEVPSGFSSLAMDLALFAAWTWSRPQDPGGVTIVCDSIGGLLDFHRAEAWYEAGRRAFGRWVAGLQGAAADIEG